ncbi:MAG: alginate lyase family protein [Ignavibacteriae bacterium]|nr:alginate lyase family protein [Ignavibacteriota bacterium]MCB9216376.1 alginate lyase family protein [Ignavibacteria bacterium]
MAYSTLAGRLKRLITSLAEHGPGHVLEVLRQSRIRRAYAQHPPQLPDLATFLDLFPESYRTAESCLNYLAGRSRAIVSPELHHQAYLQDSLSDSTIQKIERDATLISSGRFPALGLCINESTGIFDWHRDYGSGKVWPRDPFHQIRFLEGDGADVKYPWELSRMYWIGWLGLARATATTGQQKEKWSREYQRLLDNWMQENPIHVGVNWAMPMEVGIRGFWMMVGAAFFNDSPIIDGSWWLHYYSLLYGHGRYLLHNLEYFPNLTNHYIANCFGLVVLGALFYETEEGKEWFNQGKKRMGRELRRQVTSDGVHYERSISYHALVLEMYLITACITERIGEGFASEEIAIIQKMESFLHTYLPPNGTDVPQLGDSDDGIILRLTSDQDIYNHTPLAIFAQSVLQGAKTSPPTSLFAHQLTPLPQQTFNFEQQSSPLPGGFATLRNHCWHLLADVGPIGLHGNNDTLSFTLHTSDGRAWIIDPGTGCYTRDAELRNALRSTAAHNTPYIDGKEIAQFAGLWRVESDQTETEVTEWNGENASGEEKEALILVAQHHAYESLPKGKIVVERRWKVEGETIAIADRLTGSGKHRATVRFTLHPNVRTEQVSENDLKLTYRGGSQNGHLRISFSHPAKLSEGFNSPSYGIILPSTRIEITVEGEAPLKIDYLCRFVSNLNE